MEVNVNLHISTITSMNLVEVNDETIEHEHEHERDRWLERLEIVSQESRLA